MFIRTVLGDIDSGSLGRCYAHEHVIIDPSYATELEPDFRLDSVDLAVKELLEFHAAGGRAMIDTMPCACGRNAQKLAAVSRGSGVHIICPTGLHLRKYFPPQHWCDGISAEELAALFCADIEEGVDANDYSSPLVRRTAYRAGVIKAASGRDKL